MLLRYAFLTLLSLLLGLFFLPKDHEARAHSVGSMNDSEGAGEEGPDPTRVPQQESTPKVPAVPSSEAPVYAPVPVPPSMTPTPIAPLPSSRPIAPPFAPRVSPIPGDGELLRQPEVSK